MPDGVTFGRKVTPPLAFEGITIGLSFFSNLCNHGRMTNKATTTERIAERREGEIRANAEQLAHALTRTLSQSVFQGRCKCGLMLTERDRGPKGKHYSCPRCGWIGKPLTATAAEPSSDTSDQ
jgi:hypothetical protein